MTALMKMVDGEAVEMTAEEVAEREAEEAAFAAEVALRATHYLVSKRAIVERLIAAGLLAGARAALDAAPLETRERWNVREFIYADDAAALAMLAAIGADAAIIMARET